MVLPTAESVVSEVAERLLETVSEALAKQDCFELVLTGGTVGIAVLNKVCLLVEAKNIAWERVRFWFGDERFVGKDDLERNDVQANHFFETLGIDESKIMRFPAADSGKNLEEATAAFAETIENAFTEKPHFDLILNGMGPDGHVASLFPGQIEPDTDALVVAVSNSPKPPAQRLSLSLWVLNSTERVWIFAAGEEKAQAVANLFGHEDVMKIPASGLEGRLETLVYIDEAAASKVF